MFHMPFFSRGQGLALVGLLMWTTPSVAEEPEACNVCSVNSSNLQTIASALNAQDPENPAKLEKSELKKIEKGRKALVKNLIDKQKDLYMNQKDDFLSYSQAFYKVFGDSDDPKELLDILASPQSVEAALKTKKRWGVKLDDPEVIKAIELMKAAHTRIWYRDPEVRNLVSVYYEGKSDDFDKLIEKTAKRHFEDPARIAEMDRMLTRQYLEAREAYLKERKITAYEKDDLKNLDIQFALDDQAMISAPSNEHQNLSLEQLQDLALSKSEGNHQPSVFCQPFPNVPKYFSDKDPRFSPTPDGNSKKNPVPSPPEEEVIVHEDKCDLSQTFEPNATEIDSVSRDTLRNCLKTAKANPACSKGFESITASIQSCADTRRSGKFATNLDLSNARSAAMRGAFSEETKAIFGMDASASPESDEVRANTENSYVNASGKKVLTGTCGPRPPKGYNTESWMPSSKQFCEHTPEVRSQKELEECLALAPKNQLWKCDPAPKVPFKTEDEIKDYYKPYRKASLLIQYTCKNTIPSKGAIKGKGGGVAFEQVDPKESFLESIQCGVFFKCFAPKVTINTYPPDSGGPPFQFNWEWTHDVNDWFKRNFTNEKRQQRRQERRSRRCPKS